MIKLFRRLRYWLQRSRMHAELAEEMEFHRDLLARDGAPVVTMGNLTKAGEDARAVWIWPWLESLGQDVAYGLRTLRRQPAFTITALLALGSAIGINTSLFSIFDAFALHPWTVRDPSRVVTLHRFVREGGGDFGIAEYRYLAQHSQAFSGLIAMRNGEQVKLDEQARQLTYVSGNYFRVLGVDMERGRGFLDQEDRPGAPAVAVISHDLWQNHFGADPLIVGRTIRVDEAQFTVVGVTPAGFTGTNPLRNDIYTPLTARALLRPNDPSVQEWLTSPKVCCSPVAGRLAPGVSRARAQAEVAVLVDQFRAESGVDRQNPKIVAAGTAWIEGPRKKRQVIPMVLTMFFAVTLVLLLACANVGNLLLARAAARRQEIAVRLSLGGSRSRIVRQLMVESMLLALAAAALGLALGLAASTAIMRQIAEDQVFHISPNLYVLAYTIAVGILSCVAFGLAPALHGTRGGISGALKAGAEPESPRNARLPLRSVLLSVQVAISVILLVNAGLLVQAMRRAATMNPGFDVENVTVLSINLPASQYTGPRTGVLTRDLLAQLDRSPDLPAAGLVMNPPLSNSNYSTDFRLPQPGSRTLHIYFNEISGGYIAAIGMQLRAGRNFSPEDTGRDVVIINEAAVRRWWAGENPVGKTIFANGKIREIVGVISDTYTNDLSSIEAVLYFPVSGRFGAPSIVVHDRTPAPAERIAALVKQVEPRAEVHSAPLAESFQRQLQPSIYGARFAGLLGLLALAIASIGMCGVYAYVVGQRTREIGIRMALGSPSSGIVKLVLGSSLRALAAGLTAGFACAGAVSAVLVHGIPGIVPMDPIAYGAVAVLLSAAVALATAVPARRAVRVDPVCALRWE